MQKANILDAVKIINDTVKKFEGSRRFLSTGDLDFTEIKGLENVTYINRPSRANQNVQKGDIILARMQGTVKVNIIDSKYENIIVSTGFLVLRCKKDVYNRYLFHYLKSNLFQSKKDKLCSGATQKAINNNKFAEIQVPLPDLTTQKKIATILDKADELRQCNKQLIDKYDALTQSLFLEMFGDPVKNEKGWEKKKLGELGDFKNGLNYSKSDNGFKIKVIGVGDFKNFSKIDNLKKISFIEMNNSPSKEFLLHDGDLLFVRSNGNKELVGRCLIVYVGDEKVSYSGFCIRFRKTSDLINNHYLVQLLQKVEFKKHIFKNGRGANIQNINQELLNSVEIQIPPINLQNQFAERIQVIESQKQQAQEALAKSEALFKGLLQQAFNGELN